MNVRADDSANFATESHVEGRIDAAVALVNALAIDAAGGSTVTPPTEGEALTATATAALSDAGAIVPVLGESEAVELRALAEDLHGVFVALGEQRDDDAARTLNALLERSDARPSLHPWGEDPWHLHFHGPEASFVQGWTAGSAMGIAYLLTAGQGGRLRTCSASVCERVFVDRSRNGSRRFCGTACQDRVKAAAYRRRQKEVAS